MRNAAVLLILALAAIVGLGSASAGADAPLLPACVWGQSSDGTSAYEQTAVTQAAEDYSGDRETFAAAAAAYIYGYPMIDELATLKGYIHNTLVNVDALATPSTQGVVSPNVDTAYSVAWIDLTQGPLVFTVPASPDRFYTVQFMDADTNAFAYVGSGSTGTAAGSYALVPPGWSGTLPAGVTELQAPTNTLWLLARTLVYSSADLAAVKRFQAGYRLTPLAAYETGVREGGLSLASYPDGKSKSIPTGAKFIGALNQELEINPPPSGDDCAVAALAPAGVSYFTPTAAQSLSADLENIAGVTPAPAENPAVDAGLAAGQQIVAAAALHLESTLASADHGWEILRSGIGTYGEAYLSRAIIATDYLGANTPVQGLYPTDAVDVDGRALNGANRYTITFPKGDLPPAGAFWSLTMYGADNYLYANSLDRYAIGNRSTGLIDNPNGSLTLTLSHAVPASGTSNWLPAPDGDFHVILRLYEPARSALDGAWTPPPIFAAGETLTATITQLTRHGLLLDWRDSQVTRTRVQLNGPDGFSVHFVHRDRAGTNVVRLPDRVQHRILRGRYRVTLTPQAAVYDTGAGHSRRLSYTIS